ncbi:hypothetical protein O181_083606 [Austropuccinia psidii MF-1]|uniref:Uncharacterized protein n=1 Tax=Austropuccinia psidii MF-1 TaxID=1389203 RepID=A0A9Q3FUX0_9BASI|nr:hypothetical protein [Austropuccinia psidii MF-1]
MKRFRTGHKNSQTLERTLCTEHIKQNFQYGSIIGRSGNNYPEDLSQANDFDVSHGRNERLESQREFEGLRRKSSQNQRQPCSHAFHRKSWHMKELSQIQLPPYMEEELQCSPKQSRSSRPYKPRATSSKAHQSSLVVFGRRKGAHGKKKLLSARGREKKTP